jgi:hypothetical protein
LDGGLKSNRIKGHGEPDDMDGVVWVQLVPIEHGSLEPVETASHNSGKEFRLVIKQPRLLLLVVTFRARPAMYSQNDVR